jgi:hypothetical protein
MLKGHFVHPTDLVHGQQLLAPQRQRFQQHGLHHRKHAGVGADAQRQPRRRES